jgi:hypothetical protein
MATKPALSGIASTLFKAAGLLGAIYFLLHLIAPSLYGIVTILWPFNQSHPWWAPTWLIDNAYWGPTGYGVGSPLLVLTMALLTAGLIWLVREAKSSRGQDRRLLLLSNLAATVLMLATSLAFAFFAWPDLKNASLVAVPAMLYTPLAVLFVVTLMTSLVSYCYWAMRLISQRQLALWEGIVLILGLVVVNLNWLTLFYYSFDRWLPFGSFVAYLLGIGWGIGIWQLGVALSRTQPVEHSWPRLNVRKAGLGLVAIIVVWGLLIGGVYLWDASRPAVGCQVTPMAGNSQAMMQTGPDYTFSYTVTPELPWQTTGGNTNSQFCGLTTWKAPEWVFNRALQIPPADMLYFWLLEHAAPPEPDITASFYVDRNDSRFDTLDELQADMEHNQAFEAQQRASGRSGGSPLPDITYGRTTVDGHQALVTDILIKTQNSFMQAANTYIIKDDKQYLISWRVSAKTAAARGTFVQEHQSEFETMVKSFKFK